MIILEFLSEKNSCFWHSWNFSFFRFCWFLVRFSHIYHKFQEILVRLNNLVVDVEFWFWESAIAHQFRILLVIASKRKEVVNVCNLAEVRADWIKENELEVHVLLDEINSRLVITVDKIHILYCREVMETIFDHISIDHFFISISHLCNLILHLVLENLIEKCSAFILTDSSSVVFLVLNSFREEHFKSWKLHNSCISILRSEVSIVNSITCQSTCHPCCICSILSDSLIQRNKITFAFTHFLTINIDISIAVVGSWPKFVILPNSCVIEESHCQMIFDQIFSRTS